MIHTEKKNSPAVLYAFIWENMEVKKLRTYNKLGQFVHLNDESLFCVKNLLLIFLAELL